MRKKISSKGLEGRPVLKSDRFFWLWQRIASAVTQSALNSFESQFIKVSLVNFRPFDVQALGAQALGAAARTRKFAVNPTDVLWPHFVSLSCCRFGN